MMRWAAVVGLVAMLTSCASHESGGGASQNLPTELAGKVSTDGMMAHLRKLQEIADANNNTRAYGTPGYEASVDYAAQFLRDKGFDVQTPEVEVLDRIQGGNPALTVGAASYPRRPSLSTRRDAARGSQRDLSASAEEGGLQPPPTMVRYR